MNIEIFKHDVLGTMHVFGDENGLWFALYDVSDCLTIERSTASLKYKHLPSHSKQIQLCLIEKLHKDPQKHRFIHEKVVYELMCIGNSPLCDDFRKWISNIAYEFDWLNIHCNESQLGLCGDTQTNYNIVKEYIEKINDPSSVGMMAKNAMFELDEAFNNEWFSDNNKPIIKDKSYRTDYTIDEARLDPSFNPSLLTHDEEIIIEQSDEQRQELLDAFDDGRLIEYRIKPKVSMSNEEREIIYKRAKDRGLNTNAPAWLKDIIK